jgi:hypothetical protein
MNSDQSRALLSDYFSFCLFKVLLSSRLERRVNGLPAPALKKPVLAVSFQQSCQ